MRPAITRSGDPVIADGAAQPAERPKLLTADDIAEELQVALATAYRLIPTMRHFRAGRVLRVDRADFEAFKAARSTTPERRAPLRGAGLGAPTPLVAPGRRARAERSTVQLGPTRPRTKAKGGRST